MVMNSVRFWREENGCEKGDSGKFPYPVTRDHGTVSELSQLRSVTLPLARINDRSVTQKSISARTSGGLLLKVVFTIGHILSQS